MRRPTPGPVPGCRPCVDCSPSSPSPWSCSCRGAGERRRNRRAHHRLPNDVAIQDDGHLEITEVIAYDFGSNEKHGIFRDIPTRFRFDAKHDRVYPLTLRSVTADPASTPTDTKVSEVGNLTRIRICDPDITVTGQHTYVITYSVEGALNHFQDHDELFWNGIGTEWDVPIEHGETIVTAPAGITQVTCFSGPQGSSLPYYSSNVDGSTALHPGRPRAFEGSPSSQRSPSGSCLRRRPSSRSASRSRPRSILLPRRSPWVRSSPSWASSG
jgi:hypothetical protein